jgi:hypothetical protein
MNEKMAKMKKPLFLLSFLIILFSGCKKDDPDPTNTDLLTSSTWLHEYVMVDENHNLKPDDETGQLKDISFKFNTDGSLIYTKDQEIKNLNWHFEENQTTIKINGVMDDDIMQPVNVTTLDIYQLDQNSMILYYMSTVEHPETGTFEGFKKDLN